MKTGEKKPYLEKIIFVGLLILLFYPPFFRGLYFEKEMLPTEVFSFTLALIWLILKFKDKEYKLIKSPVDILGISVVFMYFISIIYGVNTRMAIAEFLKYANYFFVFILTRDMITTEKRKKIILNTLILSSVGVAIVGIGSAIGTWNYNGAVIGTRINSTLQYPNTLASYLGAMFVITIGLLVSEEKRIYKAIYAALSNIMLFTFVLTYSRGMWLILPFVLLMFILAIPNKRKFETFIYITINVLIALPLSFIFAQKLEGQPTTLWIIFIISSIAMGVITYLVSMVDNKLRNISIKKLSIGLGIIVIIAGIFVSYIINATIPLKQENITEKDKWTSLSREVQDIEPESEYQLKIEYQGTNKEEKPYISRIRVYSVDVENKLTKLKFTNITDIEKQEIIIPFTTNENTENIRVYFDNYYMGTSITYNKAQVIDIKTESTKDIPLKYKYIPESIRNRFSSIDVEGNSTQARIAFYKDATKIIKEYPLFGTGGGGWVTLYQKYQSYMYSTTQAHNYFMQMWIEIGFIGLALFIGFILAITYYIYKRYKKEDSDNKNTLMISIYIATIAILIHAFMDFDLSLSAITIVLWALIGILSSYIEVEISFNNKLIKPLTILMTLVLIITSSTMIMARSYAQKAIEANEENNLEAIIEYFEKASKFDPYKPEYKNDLAQTYKVKYKSTRDKEDIERAIKLIDRVSELTQYSSRFRALNTSFYMSIGQVDKALEFIDESVELQPMRIENYLQKSDAYLTVFKYYINQKKDINKAKEIIEKAYQIKEEIKETNKIAIKPLKYNDDLLYKIGFIQFYHENTGTSEYYIPKGYTVDFAYYFDLDMDNNEKVDKLAISKPEGSNIKYEVKQEQNTNYIRITNDGEKYGIVYPHSLKLEPNTQYKVYFKAKGTTKKETFNFWIYDNKAENKNQGQLKNIELNDEYQIFELDIKTDSDVKPGTQYLRFQHNGKDEGYIDIEEVIILKGGN